MDIRQQQPTSSSSSNSTPIKSQHFQKYSRDSSRVEQMMRDNESTNKRRPAPPPYMGQPIPRVKPIHVKKEIGNNSVGKSSSRRYDTFGENALETIYDQFKFLDESEEPSQTPSSSYSTRPIIGPTREQQKKPQSRALLVYCVLPTIELLAAIAILVCTFFRTRKISSDSSATTSSSKSSSPIISSEALNGLEFQTAISSIVPAISQIITATFGFWPIVASRTRRAARILHIAFCSLTILLWFSALGDEFLRISLVHIFGANDEKYVIELIIAIFAYFATIILPFTTLSIAAFNCCIFSKCRKSMTSITFSLGVLLFSMATTVIAIFTAQANLNAPKDVSDSSSLYAYGLKESLIFVFVVLTSIFSLIVSTQQNRPLMIGGSIGQGISLTAVTTELFTSEQIAAIVSEFKNFSEAGTTIEIGIILLNGCAIATCLLLVIQLTIFLIAVTEPIHFLSARSTSSLMIDNNRNPAPLERTAF